MSSIQKVSLPRRCFCLLILSIFSCTSPFLEPRFVSSHCTVVSQPAIDKDVQGSSGPEKHQKGSHSSPWTPADPRCEECLRCKPLIERTALGVHYLDSTIQRGPTSLTRSRTLEEVKGSNAGAMVAAQRLKDADPQAQLAWTVAALDRNIHFIVGLLSSQEQASPDRRLPSAPDVQQEALSYSEMARSRWRVESSSTREHSLEPGLPDILHPATGSSQEGPQASRILPSLSSLTSTLTQGESQSQSPPLNRALNASPSDVHMQYMRREVSARILALQNLQREHDNLLAAFSRQQAYYSTLGTNTWGSDGEIRLLTEEKARLQNQVDGLEAQVKDLIKSKEEAQQESAASRSQYMQIMAMSSRLQIQTAADIRRWHGEKEEWEKQRTNLLRKIQLQRASQTGMGSSVNDAEPSDIAGEALMSNSIDNILRADIERLERTYQGMENVVKELSDETGRLDDAMRTALQISTQIRAKVKQALAAQLREGDDMDDEP